MRAGGVVTYFVGVDLAWSPKRTSAATLATGGSRGAKLTAWRADLTGISDVIDFIESTPDRAATLVAVDAPLAVPNTRGMRECDRVATALFRAYKAGVHPVNRANLSRYQGFQGEALARELQKRGFLHAIDLAPRRTCRAFFETYPHAAAIVLFRLGERLKYKERGSSRPWRLRRQAFEDYRAYLRRLRCADPAMRIPEPLLEEDIDAMRGVQRKRYEDLLDALLCAYVSLYYWFWGRSRCSMLGTVEGGYMVLPMNDELRHRLREVSS
jgi:predicted RNase H-like nuclease